MYRNQPNAPKIDLTFQRPRYISGEVVIGRSDEVLEALTHEQVHMITATIMKSFSDKQT